MRPWCRSFLPSCFIYPFFFPLSFLFSPSFSILSFFWPFPVSLWRSLVDLLLSGGLCLRHCRRLPFLAVFAFRPAASLLFRAAGQSSAPPGHLGLSCAPAFSRSGLLLDSGVPLPCLQPLARVHRLSLRGKQGVTRPSVSDAVAISRSTPFAAPRSSSSQLWSPSFSLCLLINAANKALCIGASWSIVTFRCADLSLRKVHRLYRLRFSIESSYRCFLYFLSFSFSLYLSFLFFLFFLFFLVVYLSKNCGGAFVR